MGYYNLRSENGLRHQSFNSSDTSPDHRAHKNKAKTRNKISQDPGQCFFQREADFGRW